MTGGGQGTGGPDQDARIRSLYRRLAERVEPQFAARYDLDRGLSRYQTWLRMHTAGSARQDEIWRPRHLAGLPARAASSDDLQAAVTETLVAVAQTVADGFPVLPAWSTQRVVIELYSQHYRSLVRLAALLVRDTPTAEEVVQDAFVALDAGWGRLKDNDKALAYVRQAVVNGSRSVLRHRTVVDKNLPKAPPDMPSAEHGALVLLERSAVVAALRELPERQREAIVLRYYADLSEAEIAATMGISRGAVKSHTSRGMASLRAALEQDSDADRLPILAGPGAVARLRGLGPTRAARRRGSGGTPGRRPEQDPRPAGPARGGGLTGGVGRTGRAGLTGGRGRVRPAKG